MWRGLNSPSIFPPLHLPYKPRLEIFMQASNQNGTSPLRSSHLQSFELTKTASPNPKTRSPTTRPLLFLLSNPARRRHDLPPRPKRSFSRAPNRSRPAPRLRDSALSLPHHPCFLRPHRTRPPRNAPNIWSRFARRTKSFRRLLHTKGLCVSG
jgi:hypothetical protein